MTTDSFERRRQALEEEFFRKREQAVLTRLREEMEAEQPRVAMKRLTGIADEAAVDTLVAMKLNHETVAAFGLHPLVQVAWADGRIDEKERAALLEAAESLGLARGGAAFAAFEAFLAEPPRPEAHDAWLAWAAAMREKVEAPTWRRLGADMVGRARAVAEASGGLLGLGRRVSEREETVLAALARAFEG